MIELKKTLGSPLLLTVIGILVLINGVLFWQSQRKGSQKEVIEIYSSMREEYQQTLGRAPDTEKMKELLSAIEEENETMELYRFLQFYEEAMRLGFNIEFYETLYEMYRIEGRLEGIPEVLPDEAEMQTRIQANKMMSEQLTYLSQYSRMVATVLKNAERMGKIKQFSQQGSFAQKNIQHTAEDFEKIADIQVELVPTLGLSAWLAEARTDYFALAILLLLVAEFFRERKNGLWHIIHASASGRVSLAFRRIGLLAVSGASLCLVLYGTTLLIALGFYGEWKEFSWLSAPVQSLPGFGQCILRVSIGEFVFLRFLLKISTITTFGILFYAVMSIFSSTGGAVLAAGALLGFEFLAYRFIPVQSFTNVLKFINLFPLLSAKEFFTNYQNLNIFTNPVSGASGASVGLVILFLFSCAIAVAIQVRKYPVSGTGFLEKLLDRIRRKLAFLSKQKGIFPGEFYKRMVSGKGLLILALFAFLMLRMYPKGEMYYSAHEAILLGYYTQWEGEVTEETLAFIEEQERRIASSEASSDWVAALMQFKGEVQELQDYEAEHGVKLSIVNPYGYKAYFAPEKSYLDDLNGKSFDDLTRALLSIVAVVLLAAPIIPLEKQRGIFPVLRSTEKGRRRLFWAKWLLVFGNCVLVWLFAYGTEFAGMVHLYGLPCPGAPLHSLRDFREIPFTGSIAGYLVMAYLLRLMVLVFVASCTMALASFFKEQRLAVLCAVLLFAVPAALYYIGISNWPGERLIYWLFVRYEFSRFGKPMLYLIPGVLAIAGTALAAWRWVATKQKPE